MNIQSITDYLNELSYPSLKCSPNERLINPMDIMRYFTYVDSLRIAFVTEVLACEKSVKKLYVEELKQTISKIKQRGYCNLKDDAINAFIQAGIQEMELVSQMKDIDRNLLTSAQKALLFLSPEDVDASFTEDKPKSILADNTVKKDGMGSSFINGQEVASLFGISYNKIKDKRWRDMHGFPYKQPTGNGGKVVYIKDEVEEWVKNNGNRG